MKAKPFITLCLCALSMNVWAKPDVVKWNIVWSLYREYYSFADKAWEHRTDQYFSVYDTTIGPHSYQKVFWREEGDYTKEVLAGYALREDSDRVYVYDYASQREYVFYDFSLKKNDILAVDWIEETESRKNPVFRVLAIGDTTMAVHYMWILGWLKSDFHYLKVYDTVHQVTDMWLSGVGSVSHGIAWHRDFGRSLDTPEAVLCVDGGATYINPEYLCPTCYITQVEPEYVSFKGKLTFWRRPKLGPDPDCSKVLAIEWGELTPIVSVNSHMTIEHDPLRFRGVEYNIGDSIEVEGYVFLRRDESGWLYYELELGEAAPPIVSVEKQPRSELKLIPNPANETITLRTTGCTLQKVEILDVNGRVLYAATLNNTTIFDYNVSRLPSGIYLARVQTPCGVLTEKFSVR